MFLKERRYLDDHLSLRERAGRESSPIKDLGGEARLASVVW